MLEWKKKPIPNPKVIGLLGENISTGVSCKNNDSVWEGEGDEMFKGDLL